MVLQKKNTKFILLKLFLMVLGFFVIISFVNSAVNNITTCSNLSVAGDTYQLTSDILNSSISNCINISANNVVFDCMGHIIDADGTATYNGISIIRASSTTTNVTIKNCILSDWNYSDFFAYGGNLHLAYSNGNNITNITSFNSLYSNINLYFSSNNIISNFNTYGNVINLKVYGLSLNNIFSNFNLSGGSYGIDEENYVGSNPKNNSYSNFKIYNSSMGIIGEKSWNMTLSNFSVHNSSFTAIYLHLDVSMKIDNFSLYNNEIGIQIDGYCTYVNTSNFNISNNNKGIFLNNDNTNNNNFFNGIIKNNVIYDIYFANSGTKNNYFYNNTFDSGAKINSSWTFNSTYMNYFNYTVSGIGNIGNKWENFSNCSSVTNVSGNMICTNPNNYTINATRNIYDYAPFNYSYTAPVIAPATSSGGSIFPVYGIFSMILTFGLLFGHFFLN